MTIITSACFENFLSLPPVAGMMLGLTYLKFFSYYLQKTRDSYSVALTAGVGGSMLAVGSAAGVGLMGQAKGIYTFVSHLKWTPAIMLGYFGSIAAHFLINGRYF